MTSGPRDRLNDLVCLRLGWKGQFAGPTPHPFREMSVEPEPGHPAGRKGLLIAGAWRQLSKATSDGMMITDGDVVIDPIDLTLMVHHVAQEVEAVWTAPVRIWPKSTQLPAWVWGHRRPPADDAGDEEVMKQWQTDVDDPLWFTFCFTYLPRALVEGCLKAGLKNWHYPHVDENVHLTAGKLGIPVRVVRGGCHPRHLNY